MKSKKKCWTKNDEEKEML